MRRLRDHGRSQGTRYTMREKVFSVGDDFWIETEGGERASKVNGKALRVRDTLVLESRSGEELCSIQDPGETLVEDAAIAVIHGRYDAGLERAILEATRTGHERTFEQDPLLALRAG